MTNKITHETREAGQQAIIPFVEKMSDRVFHSVSQATCGLTAEEVATTTGIGLNNARSRCTEHFKDGRFVVMAKRANAAGTRQIAVYSILLRETI